MLAFCTLFLEILLMGTIRNQSEDVSNIMAIVMIIIFTFSLMFSIYKNPVLNKFSNSIMIGYFWRVFLLFFDLYGKAIYNLPNSGYDSEMYYRAAVQYAETGDSGRGGAFSAIMGTIFRYAGANRLFGQYISMLFSIFTICLFVLMLSYFSDIGYSNKKKIVTTICLLPNFAILSSIFLRESIVTMLITISLYCFVKWFSDKRTVWLILAFTVGLSASLFHGGSAAICLGYIIVLILYNNDSKTIKTKTSNLVFALILGLVVAYLYVNHQDEFFGKIGNISSLGQIGSTNNEGGSSYAAYVGNSNSIVSMVIFTIPRIIYFLFSPFPWQWRNLGDIIAFTFSSMFYLIAMKESIFSIKNNDHNKARSIVFLVLALCTSFVFAWGVTNTGTATRHRDKMIIIYALLYMISNKHEKHNEEYN